MEWRRIAHRIGVGALIVSCLIGVVAGGIYAWRKFAPVFKQRHYAGLRLGITMDETTYVKGVPTHVYEDQEGEWKGFHKVIDIKELEKEKKTEDYNEWGYQNTAYRIDLTFDKNKLIVIECYSEDKRERCPALGGIRDGDSEQQLVQKFGRSDTASIEGLTKTVRYPNIGAFFYLTQETIYMLGINDTQYKWGKSK